jgi:16S rRNA G527 N7-methylase RsmG
MDAYVDLLLSWNEKLNLVAASQASREQACARARACAFAGAVP